MKPCDEPTTALNSNVPGSPSSCSAWPPGPGGDRRHNRRGHRPGVVQIGSIVAGVQQNCPTSQSLVSVELVGQEVDFYDTPILKADLSPV
jgi:hypothetical protein